MDFFEFQDIQKLQCFKDYKVLSVFCLLTALIVYLFWYLTLSNYEFEIELQTFYPIICISTFSGAILFINLFLQMKNEKFKHIIIICL